MMFKLTVGGREYEGADEKDSTSVEVPPAVAAALTMEIASGLLTSQAYTGMKLVLTVECLEGVEPPKGVK